MDIQKYIAFITTAECKSFTRAAELLGYSQSAISRMIAEMEKQWNVCLFERSKSGVRLSADGRKIAVQVKKVCEENSRLSELIREINGCETGVIRIGTFSSVATHRLPQIIKRFQKDYPNIEYELLMGDYTEIENWILTGRVDFGFLRLGENKNLETIKLEEDRFFAVMPKGHALAKYECVPFEKLCREKLMVLEKGERSQIMQMIKSEGFRENIACITWDDYAIMAMAECGLGVGILPELILKRVNYDVEIRAIEPPICRSIGLAFRDRRTLSRSAQKFIEYVQSSM